LIDAEDVLLGEALCDLFGFFSEEIDRLDGKEGRGCEGEVRAEALVKGMEVLEKARA
jgi:hypothetical protein